MGEKKKNKLVFVDPGRSHFLYTTVHLSFCGSATLLTQRRETVTNVTLSPGLAHTVSFLYPRAFPIPSSPFLLSISIFRCWRAVGGALGRYLHP